MIPFIQLRTRETEQLVPGILERFRQTYESSQFILGDPVAEFEKAFAALVGTRFAVGVNSGLDALILGLRALGIGPGDEVITAPNSFVGTAAAIELVGARTVFVDVDYDFNIDPHKIEAAITPKTRAIMPVHLTGNPARMDLICDIAKKHRLRVIEDAAQAIGATFHGKAVGGWGDVGCFSLHPLKNLHVWGDGGMITTDKEAVYQQLKLQRNHGLKNRDEVEFFSYNSRLDTLQAIVGLESLKIFSSTTEKRMANAKLYRKGLAGLEAKLQVPLIRDPQSTHVYHVFQTIAPERDRLKAHLESKGIETKIHYPLPIHWQKAAAHLGYRRGDFPVTDELAGKILSLPIRESLEPAEIEEVCRAIAAF